MVDLVPFAAGSQTPAWPVPGVRKRVATYGGLAFGAPRANGARRHAGVDILAREGDLVVAPEDSEIVAAQRFNGPRAHALLLQADTGPVILLGEVEPDSWSEFGFRIGDRVSRGEPVARIGVNPGGSTMLHYEMYGEGTRRNHRWYRGQNAPSQLRDPTDYLERAASGDAITPAPRDDDDPELPEGDDAPDEPAPVRPEPTPPTEPNAMPPTDIPFDPSTAPPSAQPGERVMTPEDFAEYYAAGYEPRGKWPTLAIPCTQEGGTYYPGGRNGWCQTPDGEWCDAYAFATQRCPEGDVPAWTPEEPEDDIVDPDILPGDEPETTPGIPGGNPESPVPMWLILLGLVFVAGAID